MRALSVGHVPEDRQRVGLVMPFEACESAMLGFQDDPVYGRGVLFDRRAIIADEAAKMEAFDIRPRAPLLKTGSFSGGNQQKIVLAREIERNPKIMLVGQPTRGVDIGAIEFIHKRIVALRDAGKAVLLVSVELDEIFALSDRILVDLRGADHRRASPRRDQPARPRPADGRRSRARRMSAPHKPLPAWADVALIPLVNVAAAFCISGLVVTAIGENPFEAVRLLLVGALGDLEGVGFTLYYATSFIFTGLAVAICFHAGLFNIGVEGQAYFAGLGAALACLYLGFLPGYTLAFVAILASALFGAAFAAIPGYLQAKRDSHIVITTIMFNYIASALMGYLLVDVLRAPGNMNPETPTFPPGGVVPHVHDVLARIGVKWPATPFNLSFLIALAAALRRLGSDLAHAARL